MRSHTPLLSLALLLSTRAPAPAQWFLTPPGDTVPVIAAGATAEVLVAPTRALLYVALAGRDTAQSVATAEATATRERVTAALAQLGIRGESITLWGLGLGADLAMAPMRPPGTDRPQNVATRFGIRIVVDPISRLDAVLAALSGAGVESLAFVRFEAADDAAARRQATERAVAQARVQAEAMARAAGVRLGELRALTTMPGLADAGSETRFFYSGFPERGASLAPSEVTVRVAVQAAWRLRPE